MDNNHMMRYLPEVEAACIAAALTEWQSCFPDLGVFALLPEAAQQSVSVLQAGWRRFICRIIS